MTSKLVGFLALKKQPQQDGKNTFAYPGRDLVKTYFSMQDIAWHDDTPYKKVLELFFFGAFLMNLQILRTNNSFHQQFAKQTSSAAVTSDLFVVWHPGLWSKCLLIHGSFSGNPADPQKAHIQSKPAAVLKKLNSFI